MKSFACLIHLLCLALLSSVSHAQVLYRSATNGNWSSSTTWEAWNGTSWIAASTTPTSADSTITILNTHTVTLDAPVTIDQVIVEAGAILTTNAVTVGIIGSSNTIHGLFNIANGATVNAGILHVIGGGITLTGGSVLNTSNDPAVILDGTATLSIPPAGGFNGIMRVNSGTTTLTSSSATGTLDGPVYVANNAGGDPTAVLTIASGKTLMFRNDLIVRPEGTISGPGTITYSGDGATFGFVNNGTVNADVKFQRAGTGFPTFMATTGSPSWQNVEIDDPDGVALNLLFGGSPTIHGTLTLTSGTFNLSTYNINLGNGATIVRSQGEFSKLPIFGSTIDVVYAGTSAVVTGFELPSSTTVLNNLTINNPGGVTLNASRTVNGTLTLANGIVSTGANTLTVAASGAVSGGSPSSYVDGKMSRIYNSVGPKAFPLGKGGNFRPVSVNYTSLDSTSIVTSEVFDFPLSGTSPPGIIPFNDRHWIVTQSGATSFVYDIILDGTGLNPSSMAKVIKEDGGNQVAHDAIVSANNYTGSGFTSFSGFALGQVKTYIMNLAALQGIVAKNPDQAAYDSNTVVQLTATPNSGYHFVNWSGDLSGSTNPASVTMDGNKNITANFAINQYTITITATNGTVAKNPDQASYDSNTVVQLAATPNSGYHFVNWSGDLSGSATPASVTMDGDKNITANFAINQYAITITATNGTVAKNPDQAAYDSNTVVQLTATPNSGYHFVGWSGDLRGSATPASVTMDGNKNITANFAINQYTLNITATNGTVAKNPDQATYDSNTVVQLTAIPNTGYHFVSWSGDLSGSSNPALVTMDRNKNITANFAINQYTLNSTATNGAVAKNPDQATYDSNTVVQLTAIPNTGYHFVNWSGDLSGSTNPASVTMDGDKNITANFAINQYTITITATNGTVAKNPDQASYDSNMVVQLTATPNTGYHFVSWSGDLSGSANPASVTMDGNKNITANFAINQYTLNITATNGTVAKNPDQAAYDSNTVVQLMATPHSGYHFVNWSGDLIGSTNPDSVTMDANKNITTNFAINQYTLNITATNGTVAKNPDQAAYDSNTVVQLTATPNTGYHFVSWSGDLSGSTNPASVTMDGNKTIAANFAINQYTIVSSAGPHGSISPSGLVLVNHGGTQTFTITANSGHEVDSLFIDSISVAVGPEYTFTNVMEDHSIRVTFKLSFVTVATPISEGWNMISNPVTAANDSVRILYPTSSFAFAFSFNPGLGYQQTHTMANGIGFWEKFPAPTTQSIVGLPRVLDSVSVVPGWNMIGTISSIVDTSAITSIPGGLRTSQWFGFGMTGYAPASQLIPGRGYWVQSSGSGKFVLAGSPLARSTKTAASDPGIEDALNILTVTDGNGSSQTLFFGADAKNEIQLQQFIMPPPPPVGVLDARFETNNGGSLVQTHAQRVSKAVEFPVLLQADAYPVTVSWKIKAGAASYELANGASRQLFSLKAMAGEGYVEIADNNVRRLLIRVAGDGQLPNEFALHQNYPNPFNPCTTILYDLPVAGHVTIKIFNIIGREIATLVNEEQNAGYRSVAWNANEFASGVYFYQLVVGNFTASKKLLLLK